MNICPVCKKPSGFKTNGTQRVFCSNECKFVGRKNGEKITCLHCNKEIYVRPCEKPLKKFCSPVCSSKYHSVGSLRKNGTTYECPICHNQMYVQPSILKSKKNGIKYCSMICKTEAMKRGDTNFGFKDEGADKTPNIRKRIQVNKQRVYEHRYIMEQHIGRKIEKGEHVHHINGNPKDNRIENLQVLTASEHSKLHKSHYSGLYSNLGITV